MAYEGLVDKLKENIRSGLIFMAGAYANEYVSERLARKYLSEYAELGVGLGTAIALDMIGAGEKLSEYEPYLRDFADAMSDYGFYKSILDAKLVKKPMCWAKDANTLKCINFDADAVSATNTTVYIDDTAVTPSGVTGDPGAFEVSLPAPLASGWHKLVVIAGTNKKDAVRGKVYVG